ncbi:hypothetical protein HHK36_028325 [Tetracentron sinense]|uniref:Uncharacterized protein n=1 Tax=Tetracentron sinense TaxID=13715 RepID=A0A835D4D0_TETSI|nr:hypothetical protein HHK36_028325 [Tetracentron sinense]
MILIIREKSRLREEIVARRQEKLLVRHARQKYLEEASLREAEILRELDRESYSGNWSRQNLESDHHDGSSHPLLPVGIQAMWFVPSNPFSAAHLLTCCIRITAQISFDVSACSRPRERYRERDNVRSGNEGSLRPSSSGRESGTLQPATSTSGSMVAAGLVSLTPAVVLSGSRPFSGQLPTILQSRDRSEERGSSYEENFDGSKDSGDTGSVGDPDLVSAFDGQAGGLGSAQRHGSRGSKSRQIMERKERDRREGKWERKHS